MSGLNTEMKTTEKLNSFISSLGKYTDEYESILTDISQRLPAIENQIDENVLKAKELLSFIFSSESETTDLSVKHELEQFHLQLNRALETLKDSEKIDNMIFSELRDTIVISNSAMDRIKEIYNISEDLKVFAINSIVYSQKEGSKGKGYQIISGNFIKLSEEIAKGTILISEIGIQMNDRINVFLNEIDTHEKFIHDHILNVSKDSQKLVDISNKSVENFAMVFNDLLSRIDAVKNPTYNIMIELQKQDIIEQQMRHLMDVLADIVHIIMENENLLDLSPESLPDEDEKSSYRNISTLLKFLLLTTEKQMGRINNDVLSMINNLDREFMQINNAINDVNSDKRLIGQLVISEKSEENEASIINLIFQAPKKTIEEILVNLDTGQKQKQSIISIFSEINTMVQSEKKITSSFIPIIESINNLLLLARIEQARNSLNISYNVDSENDVFSQSAFSDLEKIIEDMENSELLMSQNLVTIYKAFSKQTNKYTDMKEQLGNSFVILENTENIFMENYNSVMNITDTLSGEIRAYSSLFTKLRDLHKELSEKINICTEIRHNIEKQLDILGGPINLNECQFRDTTINQIVEKLTVEEERTTISNEFSELKIEKSTGNSITLF